MDKVIDFVAHGVTQAHCHLLVVGDGPARPPELCARLARNAAASIDQQSLTWRANAQRITHLAQSLMPPRTETV